MWSFQQKAEKIEADKKTQNVWTKERNYFTEEITSEKCYIAEFVSILQNILMKKCNGNMH